jgi:DNA processing protein
MSRTLDADVHDKTISPAELLGRSLNPIESTYAPKHLFCAGDPAILSCGVGVSLVGTRSPSDLGGRRARKLAKTLVEHGYVVISGLARGIDTCSHRGAIEAGGRTVAVIGSGLDVCYPKENAELQRLIGKDHLLVSQFAAGTPPCKSNFPQRNRTMALLSYATVVIEAGETSGTRSQGWEALRLGRPLFLLKSLVDNPALKWPASMLEYGACLLERPEELFEVLPPATAEHGQSVAF